MFIRVEDFGHEFYAIVGLIHVSFGIYTFEDSLHVDSSSAVGSSTFGRYDTQCVDVESDPAFGQLIFLIDQEASVGVVVQLSVLEIDCRLSVVGYVLGRWYQVPCSALTGNGNDKNLLLDIARLRDRRHVLPVAHRH